MTSYEQKKSVIFFNYKFVVYIVLCHFCVPGLILDIFSRFALIDNYMGRLNATTESTIIATTCFVPAT